MAIRVRKDKSDREGASALLQSIPPEASFITSSQQKLLFLPREALCPLSRELTGWFLLHGPRCKIHLNAYQPTNYRPQTCLGCLSQERLRLQMYSPHKGHARCGHFLSPHQAGCLCELYPTLITQGDWGGGLWSFWGPKEQPRRGVCSWLWMPVIVTFSARIPSTSSTTHSADQPFCLHPLH